MEELGQYYFQKWRWHLFLYPAYRAESFRKKKNPQFLFFVFIFQRLKMQDEGRK